MFSWRFLEMLVIMKSNEERYEEDKAYGEHTDSGQV